MMEDHAYPFARQGLLHRSAPFASVMLLAFAAVPLLPGAEHDPRPLIAAALLNALIVAAVLLVPWRRLPGSAQAVPPIAYLLVIALLRDDGSGTATGYQVLALLPVFWVALYGTVRQLSVALAALLVLFVSPAVVTGSSVLPEGQLAQALFSVAIGAMLVLVTQGLLRESRQRTREALLHVEAEERANRLKNELFSLISHDLRTPLTSIKGYVELMLEEDVETSSTQGRSFLEVIARNTTQLERTVGDLLFIAELETGEFTLQASFLDLGRLVTGRVEAAQLQAEKKKIELTARAESVAETSGDPGRLAQLLDNLISNALKFTPEGGRVEVRLHEENEQALVEVEDSGIGIPAACHERLFERFFRAPNATEQVVPGIGLGLTIVKAIAEAHGGRVSLSSEEGAGTTFRVELPLNRRVSDKRAAGRPQKTAR